MQIYNIDKQDNCFLGVEPEDKGFLINYTEAFIYYLKNNEINLSDEPYYSNDEVVFLLENELFAKSRIEETLEYIDKKGLIDEFTVYEDDNIYLLPPLIPKKIIALGNNYKKHIEEMGQKLPESPVLFGKWPSTIISPGAPIVKPEGVEVISYEAELAFVIKKIARKVPKENAMDYVAAYTCLNDVTNRDMQSRDLSASLPWMPSKNHDTFCPIGPCLLMAEDVEDPVELNVKSFVNEKNRQDGNTRDFIFDIPSVIEYITNIMTLYPGDIISTGTPEGVGPIEHGDEVTVYCEGVGELINFVIDESEYNRLLNEMEN